MATHQGPSDADTLILDRQQLQPVDGEISAKRGVVYTALLIDQPLKMSWAFAFAS